MTNRCAIAVLVLAYSLAGCNSRSPVAPAPVPQAGVPQPLPQPTTAYEVFGYVADTAFRPLAGVTVEVVDGPQAGMLLTSGAAGAFTYSATFGGSVTVRATKDGYITATKGIQANPSLGRAWIFFEMAPIGQPVQAAGVYALTITADSTCSALPDQFRTRGYAAKVVSRANSNGPANMSFDGSVSGGAFHSNLFWIGVAADYVAISLEGEGPSIVEKVAPDAYLAFYGTAGSSVATSTVSTITSAFDGSIEYCVVKSPTSLYDDCYEGRAITHEVCQSKNHQLTLTRR
jgi:hypothetical protein